jgi:multiple sugar transport system permease protein
MRITHRPWTGFAYVLPAIGFTAAFVLYPLLDLVYISLTDLSLMGGGRFVGFANYVKAWNDKAFWQALQFTIAYTLFLTPVLMALGFLLALLTVRNTAVPRLTRAIVFMPVVIGLGTSSLMWVWLFDQQVGLVNRLLTDLHIIGQPLPWFTAVGSAFAAICFSVTWKVVGFAMILFIAALQSIGHEVQEAAIIDGASYWQRVWRVLLPLSRRTLLLATLISAIGSMLAFDQFYIMTGGGPRGQTFTAVYWVYQNSFVYFKLGYGAALSIILALIILVGSTFQVWLNRRQQQG